MAELPADALVIELGSHANENDRTIRALRNIIVQFGAAPYNTLVIDRQGNRAYLNIGNKGFTGDPGAGAGLPTGYSEVELEFCHPTLGNSTGKFLIKDIAAIPTT